MKDVEILKTFNTIMNADNISEELQSAMAEWFRETAKYNKYLAERKRLEIESILAEPKEPKEPEESDLPWDRL